MNRHRSNGPLLGLLAGVAGASAGLYAMRLYWGSVAPRVEDAGDRYAPRFPSASGLGLGRSLDEVSLVGRQHREDESSTAAIGRIAFETATGREPSDETKPSLSYGVHWGYGLAMGGLYGLLRRRAGFPDLTGGLLYGAALWLLGDELAVPLLGLQAGPTSASPAQHVNRLGAHLVYGAGTAAATQSLLGMADATAGG